MRRPSNGSRNVFKNYCTNINLKFDYHIFFRNLAQPCYQSLRDLSDIELADYRKSLTDPVSEFSHGIFLGTKRSMHNFNGHCWQNPIMFSAQGTSFRALIGIIQNL